ncbi:MAG: PepSY domain-containing protein [bacterium]|nr:PepSY domain-containing protein [bacterium]
MSSHDRRRVRATHHGLGLFLALGALLVVATGLALQHPAWLGRGAMPPRVLAADPVDPQRLLRASPALLEESRDGGATWRELPLPAAPDLPLTLVFASPPARGAWLLGVTELLASVDGGAVWDRRELPPRLGRDDPPLGLAVTADGRPLVVTMYGAWLADADGARWTSLWQVAPTRGDRLRDLARRLHAGHWGLPFMPRLYDLGTLLFVVVLVTGLVLGLHARKRQRKHHRP